MARSVGEAPRKAAVSRVRKKYTPLSFEDEARGRRIADKQTESLSVAPIVGTIPMRALDSFYGEERMVHSGAPFAAATQKRADDLVAAGLAVRVI